MIYVNILIQDLERLNNISQILINNLQDMRKLITKKSDIHKLEESIKVIDSLNMDYNNSLEEVKDLVYSTHYKKLSDIVKASNSEELRQTYNKTIHLTNQIHRENREVKALLDLCQRLNTNHMNLIFGKVQQPTNYNLDKNNINKHMLNRFKNTR